jgi:LPXTG-site transpeptidase (sortase) family protein
VERRRAGLAIFLAGSLSFSLAGSRYAMGAVAQDEARRIWDSTAAHAAVESARSLVARDRAPGTPARGEPVARLIVPGIGLDEIVLEGVDDDALNGGPGHLPGTPLPGDAGNSVISAHRDRHFRKLGAVSVGDTVVTQSGTRKTSWVIVRRRIVDKDQPVILPAKNATLTLTTCWPIQYLGTAPERLILTATPAH